MKSNTEKEVKTPSEKQSETRSKLNEPKKRENPLKSRLSPPASDRDRKGPSKTQATTQMPIVMASQDNSAQTKATSKIGSGIPRLQGSKLPSTKSVQQLGSPTQDTSKQKSLLYQKTLKSSHQRTNSNTTNPLVSQGSSRTTEVAFESRLKQASQKQSMLSDFRNDVSFSQSDSFSNQQQHSS